MTQPSHAHAPINYSLRRVVDAADAIIPAQPSTHYQAKTLWNQREMLLVGIGWEMPVIRPSYPELEEVVGCRHATAMAHLQRWHAMPWRDRHAWLMLVEGRLAYETNPVDAVLL